MRYTDLYFFMFFFYVLYKSPTGKHSNHQSDIFGLIFVTCKFNDFYYLQFCVIREINENYQYVKTIRSTVCYGKKTKNTNFS